MFFRELPPSPPLAPYVQLIWCLELDTAAEFGPPERVAPDGILELVLHYREPFTVGFAGEASSPQPRSSVVSQTRRYLEMQPTGRSGLIAVRFRPWGAHHFLSLPVSELTDRVVAAEDLWGRGVGELEERLAAADHPGARVRLVESFLLSRLRNEGHPRVEGLVRTVWKYRGQVGVGALAREVGLSERTLQRRFGTALGMRPKGYARLARFLHACSVLRRWNGGRLADVGHDCGYYDQAHFIADFKAFSGLTPGQFATSTGVSFLELE